VLTAQSYDRGRRIEPQKFGRQRSGVKITGRFAARNQDRRQERESEPIRGRMPTAAPAVRELGRRPRFKVDRLLAARLAF
jgi:hypothetical protein